MTRYLIIFLIIIIAILLIVTIAVSIQKGKQPSVPNPQPVLTAPSKSPISVPSTNTQANLSIVSISPDNNSANIPLNQSIIITFNQIVAPDNISFFANPTLDYSLKANSNTITITPSKLLLSGITYTYQINIKNPHQSFSLYSFTTIGTKQKYLPDTQPSGMAADIDAFNKQDYPDVFLGSKVPYSTANFSISGGGIKPDPQPKGHYYFIVILKGNQQTAKDSLVSWLQSLSLTDLQIQGLDIQYQTQ